MSWSYEYTPYVLPMLAPAAFMAALAIYVWRRRSVPAARALAVGMLFTLPWAVGAALEMAAVDFATKVFWIKFQALWQLPSVTAYSYFILEYAYPGRWLNRQTRALLAIPPVLGSLLMLTNDIHHWMWLDFQLEGYIHPVRGGGLWLLVGYAGVLRALQLPILLWLFVRSPLHRWPVTLILASSLVRAIAYQLDITDQNPFAPLDPTILTMPITSAAYALALFHFRMFDPIRVARAIVIDQLPEGMLVLDAGRRIVDLNPAAVKILGASALQVRDANWEALTACPDMDTRFNDRNSTTSELTLGTGDALRNYVLRISPLRDPRGFALGHLVLLHDVTEQKRAQEQLLQQQRVVATLEERERLARELHDTLVQSTASIRMQAEAASALLERGEKTSTRACLARLADVAQDMHLDLREYIFEATTAIAAEENFLAALRDYLAQFSHRWGIPTRLRVSPELEQHRLRAAVEMQFLRIVQEALSNVRKHAAAHCAEVTLTRDTNAIQISIQDDGCGFDPAPLSAPDARGFGLRSMRERAQAVGGTLEVCSAPGQGTRVVVKIPWEK